MMAMNGRVPLFLCSREPRLVESGAQSKGNMALELFRAIGSAEREVPIQTVRFFLDRKLQIRVVPRAWLAPFACKQGAGLFLFIFKGG